MFGNPCHKCIVRAACSSSDCDIYEKFAKKAIIIIIATATLLIPVYIFLLYLVYKYLHHNLYIFAYTIFFMWVMSATIFGMLDDKPDIKSLKPYIVFLLSPWFLNVVIIARSTKKYGRKAGADVSQELL